MFTILIWCVYGFIVGVLAKLLIKASNMGPTPVGFLPTIMVGVVGSYVGGAINWLLNLGSSFSPAGILMGTLGGVIFCWAFTHYQLNQYVNIEVQKLKDREKSPYDQ